MLFGGSAERWMSLVARKAAIINRRRISIRRNALWL
jgi:hypothetical protein